MSGVPQIVAKLLYGSGLRISEATRLRVHDIDFNMKTLTVRHDLYSCPSAGWARGAQSFG